MQVRFWGVRGSVPWATPASIGYGCNTACVEVSEPETGAHLILDAGSGLVGLGHAFTGAPRPIAILLSHYHWDHLQGLPFFAPLFQTGWSPSIQVAALDGVAPAALETVFAAPFFSIPFHQLPSRPTLALVDGGTFTLGGFEVSAMPLTHPGGAFAYRVHGRGKDLVYATDHEFGDGAADARLAVFARKSAALILDAHFTPEELVDHRGWGHASWQQAAEFAGAADAGHLWLFHHKPGRTDEQVAVIESRAREVFPATTAAREGVAFDI